MGDPRKLKKLYKGPRHPWQGERIEAERGLLRDFGLKNKLEIQRVASRVKTLTSTAKRLIASSGKQADIEKEQLFATLHGFGLLAGSTNLDDVLALLPKDLLERRLQTLIFRKGLARSVKQARQFISHNHVMISGRIVSAPGYLVKVNEEPSIVLRAESSLASPDHPERVPIVKKPKKVRPREPRKGGRR